VPDPIRVATISPAGESERLFAFVRELNATSKATERREYLPEWPGFQRVFGLHMRGAGRRCHIELDQQLEIDMEASPSPHVILAERLLRAATKHLAFASFKRSVPPAAPPLGDRVNVAALAFLSPHITKSQPPPHSGSDGSQTRCWREMDSNPRSR